MFHGKVLKRNRISYKSDKSKKPHLERWKEEGLMGDKDESAKK